MRIMSAPGDVASSHADPQCFVFPPPRSWMPSCSARRRAGLRVSSASGSRRRAPCPSARSSRSSPPPPPPPRPALLTVADCRCSPARRSRRVPARGSAGRPRRMARRARLCVISRPRASAPHQSPCACAHTAPARMRTCVSAHAHVRERVAHSPRRRCSRALTARLRGLVETFGTGNWEQKGTQLGTGRTTKVPSSR